MQRVAIVDPTESTRESLRTLLLGVDFVWLEAECARYEFFFDVIRQSIPDVAIICLDADQPKAIQLIGQVATEAPEMPILAVSGRNVPARRLAEAGWRVRDAHAVTLSYDSFVEYVAGSRGEFSVAKHVFVETWSGWFSERSAVYLASGATQYTTGRDFVIDGGYTLF